MIINKEYIYTYKLVALNFPLEKEKKNCIWPDEFDRKVLKSKK